MHNLAASQCSVRSDPRVELVHLTQHALPEISASNALSLIAWILEKDYFCVVEHGILAERFGRKIWGGFLLLANPRLSALYMQD